MAIGEKQVVFKAFCMVYFSSKQNVRGLVLGKPWTFPIENWWFQAFGLLCTAMGYLISYFELEFIRQPILKTATFN